MKNYLNGFFESDIPNSKTKIILKIFYSQFFMFLGNIIVVFAVFVTFWSKFYPINMAVETISEANINQFSSNKFQFVYLFFH